MLGQAMIGALQDAGFEPELVDTIEAAKARMRDRTPSIMILDLSFPSEFGGDFLEELGAARSSSVDAPPTVIVSAFPLAGIIADRYGLVLVRKPFSFEQLLEAIDHAQLDVRRPRSAKA